MNSSGIRIGLLYVVGSISFLLLPLLFAPGTPSWDMFRSSHLRRDLVVYGLVLGFYYLNQHVLMPKLFFPKRHVWYGVAVALAIGLIVVLPTILLRHHPHYPRPHHYHNEIHLYSFSHPFFLFLVSLFFSMLIAFQTRYKQSERDRLKAELSYLKAQINPHFLFNSLNSIYALALSKSDLASEAVLKLSGMMRYVLAKANQELVMLEEEINYLSDFIALQRIRLGNTAKVEYRLEVTPDKGTMIAPLLLIPFVENAFKHGVDPEKEAEILVVLRVEGRSLTLETHNRKCSPIHFLEDEGGIGLSNTRERLKVLYPGRHHLKIVDDGVRFSIVLEIQL